MNCAPAFPPPLLVNPKCRLRSAYIEFFKTDDGRKFAGTFGRRIPVPPRYRRHNFDGAARLLRGEADIEFCDPADLPRSSIIDHPIDHIEPAENFRPLDGLTREQIHEASAVFEMALRWCIESPGLIGKGQRCEIVIACLRKDLSAGLRIDSKEARSFKRANAGANGSIELSGRLFGPVLGWLRRGKSVSEFGERILVLIYVLRPDLIGGSTLAELGRISNKTRQAKDKLANCLRDTYSGIQARAMRGAITRARCRKSPRRPPITYAYNY